MEGLESVSANQSNAGDWPAKLLIARVNDSSQLMSHQQRTVPDGKHEETE